MARAAYWQGRTAEAAGQAEEARGFYEAAAQHSSTYYGQLARTKLGVTELPVRMPPTIAQDDARNDAVRGAELLIGADAKDLATSLAADAARHLSDASQLAALAQVVAASRDPRATLTIGKIASQRGFALDEVAFPTFGVPAYEPLARSAPLQVVYAIARQESAFEAKAQSSAGAKGLMQMLPSTARRTAQNAGVPFDEARLVTDASFNAQLGAAHLGELLGEQRGSLVLTFAAYNAGGRRVKEWIAAYGDPRDASVDPIDWVERIPFTETRNYVQRVVENLEMYRARFGQRDGFDIVKTLRTAQAKP
jgi:soluble lytic murein transglycosylase